MSRMPFDQALDTWMAEGPDQLPTYAVDRILTTFEENEARKSFWLPGRGRMNRMMLAIGGVAAGVALTLLALGLYVGLNFNPPGFGGQPSPTASPTPIPTALPEGDSAVEPGRYVTDYVGYRYTFTVSGAGWLPTVRSDLLALTKEEAGNASSGAGLFIWGPTGIGATVFNEPCQWVGTGFAPGPTTDDLATALAGLDGFETTQPTDVTLDGYRGKRLQLTVPQGAKLTGCQQNEYRSIEGRWYQGPGQVDDIRILDLDGTRTYFYTTYFPGTPEETWNELEQMVASLEIEPIDR